MTSADSGHFLDKFLRQAAATPDRPAAEFGDRHLTYAELDARAAASAARLRSLGVGPGATVGVLLEPSLDLVTSVLAVARAGAAWLPLDPPTRPTGCRT